jgi:hypothetical protein
VHDLWHLLFDCRTSVLGELALKAVEFVQVRPAFLSPAIYVTKHASLEHPLAYHALMIYALPVIAAVACRSWGAVFLPALRSCLPEAPVPWHH